MSVTLQATGALFKSAFGQLRTLGVDASPSVHAELRRRGRTRLRARQPHDAEC
jgi:hypothetical protein